MGEFSLTRKSTKATRMMLLLALTLDLRTLYPVGISRSAMSIIQMLTLFLQMICIKLLPPYRQKGMLKMDMMEVTFKEVLKESTTRVFHS